MSCSQPAFEHCPKYLLYGRSVQCPKCVCVDNDGDYYLQGWLDSTRISYRIGTRRFFNVFLIFTGRKPLGLFYVFWGARNELPCYDIHARHGKHIPIM